MSRFLETFEKRAARCPERRAFFNSRGGEGSSITFGELSALSDNLAAALAEKAPAGKPVVVYGHKSPLMLVSFLAAVKAGLTYAPVDIAYPADRVSDILAQLDRPLVLSLADGPFVGDAALAGEVWDEAEVRAACAVASEADRSRWIADETPFYLLFTSGSTGRPKGVQMPSRCVDAFMDYFSRLFPSREDGVSFNRVPYTFDVSLFDIIGALPFGYTLFSLESEHEQSMRDTFEALRESGMTAWISTPSFAEMCLADRPASAAP